MNDDSTFGRRAALKGLAGLGLAASVVPSVNAAETSADDAVERREAKLVADRMVAYYGHRRPEHSHWLDGSLGRPTTYHKRTGDGGYEPAAFVFPVTADGDTAGHITVAATRSWSPVLEYGNAAPPSADLDTVERAAQSMGLKPTGRLLYQGGSDYGLEVTDGEMLHLGSRQLAPVRETSELLAHDRDDIRTADTHALWDRYTSASFDPAASAAAVTPDSSTRLDFWPHAWDGHYGEGYPEGDASGGDAYPSNRGLAADSWDSWDGCSPIAGTQIVMFHEGWDNTSANVEKREAICDALHHLMNTNDAGWTDTYDLDNGINQIAGELDFLTNSYSGENEYLLSKSLIRSQIDAGQPCVFTNYNTFLDAQRATTSEYDPREKKTGDNYNGHSVVMSGYDDGGDTFEIDTYTGWYTYRNTITYGSWDSTSMVTKVKV